MTNPSDPTPERPGMTDPEEPATLLGSSSTSDHGEDDEEETDGEISEVGRLGQDATATTDDGADAPDAIPPENRRDNDMKPHDRQLGESVEDS